MKVGDLVRVKCDNHLLNGKVGTIVLYEKTHNFVYGLCVLIQGLVYGFEDDELEVVNESR